MALDVDFVSVSAILVVWYVSSAKVLIFTITPFHIESGINEHKVYHSTPPALGFSMKTRNIVPSAHALNTP